MVGLWLLILRISSYIPHEHHTTVAPGNSTHYLWVAELGAWCVGSVGRSMRFLFLRIFPHTNAQFTVRFPRFVQYVLMHRDPRVVHGIMWYTTVKPVQLLSTRYIHTVASELNDPIWHSLEWQIRSFSSEATIHLRKKRVAQSTDKIMRFVFLISLL